MRIVTEPEGKALAEEAVRRGWLSGEEVEELARLSLRIASDHGLATPIELLELACARGRLSRAQVAELRALATSVTSEQLDAPPGAGPLPTTECAPEGLLPFRDTPGASRSAVAPASVEPGTGTLAADRTLVLGPGAPPAPVPGCDVPSAITVIAPEEFARAARLAQARVEETSAASPRPAAPPPAPEPYRPSPTQPRVLGEYLLVGELGRGGMGIVYEAIQQTLGRRVALKVIRTEGMDGEGLERFRREAAAAGRLTHPGIVRVYDAGSANGNHFYAMELIDGRPLDAFLIREGPLEPLRAARIAAAVGEALIYAHDQRIVHRDIKPANVLITAGDRPLVTDFGLARDLTAPSLTASAQMLGTPRYMSPEQAEGNPGHIDHRTDQYSLGATLYEMVTGAAPFNEDNVGALINKLLFVEPPAVRDRRPDTPADLARIIEKAMDKERGHRYPDMRGLVADLDRFVRGEPVSARPRGFASRLARRVRRHPRWAGAGAGTALAVLVLLALWRHAWREGEDRSRAIAAAAAHLRQSRPGEAARVLTDYMDHTRPHAALLVERAAARRAAGDSEGASVDLDAALALEPGHFGARVARAAVRVDRGNTLGAMEDVELVLAAEPERVDARICRAQVQLRRGDAEAAETDCTRALEGLGSGPERALTLATRAEARRAQGKLDLALHDADASVAEDPGLPDAYRVRGRIRAERGLDAEAESEYGEALSREPGDVEAREGRARARWMRGDTRGALADAREWAAHRPRDWAPRLFLARLLWATGGAEALAEASETLGRNAEADWLLGSILLSVRNVERAAAAFQRALEADASSAEAEEGLGRVATARGDREQALRRFERAVALAPERPGAHVHRAAVLAAVGREAEAEEEWRRGDELASRDRGLGSLLLVRARLAYTRSWGGPDEDLPQEVLALELSRVDRFTDLALTYSPWDARAAALKGRRFHVYAAWNEAKQAYEEAVALNPCNVDARLGLGMLLRDSPYHQDLAAALRHLDQACAFGPQEHRAFLERAVTRKLAGEPAGAQEDLERASENEASRPMALWLRADLLRSAGDAEGAAPLLAKWLDSAGRPEYGLFYYVLGRQAQRHGEAPSALRFYSRAISENPRYSRAFDQRAGMLLKTGRMQDALADYARSCQLRPIYFARVLQNFYKLKANPLLPRLLQPRSPEPDAASHLAAALVEWGRDGYPAAHRYAVSATERDPEFVAAWIVRGLLEVKVGDLAAAAVSGRRARAIDPQNAGLAFFGACLAAAEGRTEDAVASTTLALQLGLERQSAIWSEPVLKPLDACEAFRALLNRK
ncbi:MAG: protein kinase [Planctomycetes bacterium]|nr:protein kinase [Planctomycetota bacterium]